MSKVDKDTRAELRRLVAVPGHDRIGLMAKGCITDLLNELERLESLQAVPKPPAPVAAAEDKPEKVYADSKPKGKWNAFKSKTKVEDEDKDS